MVNDQDRELTMDELEQVTGGIISEVVNFIVAKAIGYLRDLPQQQGAEGAQGAQGGVLY